MMDVSAVAAQTPTVTYAPWLTPGMAHRMAGEFAVQQQLGELVRLAENYVATACRPVLDLPHSARPELPDRVIEHAVASTDARMSLLLGALRLLGLRRFLDLGTLIEAWLPEFRARAAPLFAPDYVACFEMGARIYVNALRRMIAAIARHGAVPAPTADKVQVWYEFFHVASCLDLSATAVLWYIEADAAPERAAIPEELCYLVKEFALSYGALMQLLLQRDVRSRASAAEQPTEEDVHWDRDFCSLTLPDLRRHLTVGE